MSFIRNPIPNEYNFYGRSIQPNGYTDFRSEAIKREIDHSGIPKSELEYKK
jgi:hypothetical protein